ncbi:hypothetical protein DIPPA_18685 [Diplonema papillatum]|nr:hypothetical protein DIPPA_18685 [Diplonema papillatum]
MEAFCAIIVASSFASCADLVADENVYNTANCTAAEVGAVCEAECVDGLAGEPSEFECELDAADSSTWAGWWEVCRTVMGVAGNATGTAGDEVFTITEGTSGTVVIHGGGGADRFQATANPGLHLVVMDFDAEDDELAGEPSEFDVCELDTDTAKKSVDASSANCNQK